MLQQANGAPSGATTAVVCAIAPLSCSARSAACCRCCDCPTDAYTQRTPEPACRCRWKQTLHWHILAATGAMHATQAAGLMVALLHVDDRAVLKAPAPRWRPRLPASCRCRADQSAAAPGRARVASARRSPAAPMLRDLGFRSSGQSGVDSAAVAVHVTIHSAPEPPSQPA